MKTLIRNVKLFDGTALAPRPMDVLFDESGILAVIGQAMKEFAKGLLEEQ